MTKELRPARANWGGVVITAAAVVALVGDVVHEIPSAALSDVEGDFTELTILVVPIALIVGFVPLAFGSRRLRSIVGDSWRSRTWLFAAPIVAALAEQFGSEPVIPAVIYPDGEHYDINSELNLAFFVLALATVLGFVAGIAVVRAGIATGLARWSLLVTVVLILATVVLNYFGWVLDWYSWLDLPRSLGLLVLGVSYWRVGIRSTVPAEPVAEPSVTEPAKSLAE